MTEYKEIYVNDMGESVYPTFLPWLNRSLYGGGLKSSMLCLLTGYPKGYKTMFSVNLAVHQASIGAKVLYLTPEPDNVKRMVDILCAYKGVDVKDNLSIKYCAERTLELHLFLSAKEGFNPALVICDPIEVILNKDFSTKFPRISESVIYDLKKVLQQTGVILFATAGRCRDRKAERHYAESVGRGADLIMHLGDLDTENKVNLDVTHSRYGLARARYCLDVDAPRCLIRD